MKRSVGNRSILEARGRGKVVPLFSLLCLLLVLVAAGATVAVADDPEGQPPGPPSAIEMQEGLNADNSEVYEAELTDLQAAEELPHQDLDRTQALDLLVGVFDPALQAPAGIFDELDVERFLSANAAIIAAGDQPQSNGVSIGAPPEDRYEGTTLLESTIPLRDESDAGKTEVVDLGLEPEGDGTIAPSNPLVEVSLPQQLGDGIELPEVGITVELEGAPGALSPSTLDQGVAAYPEVAEDTTLAVAPAPGGFETFTLLQSPDAPTSQTFTLDLPAGASLQATRDGGAEVVRDGEPIMGVTPPTALDAAGENVPASMTVSGNALTLDVSPQASTEFPVLLDPLYETYNWWNGITGLGGWHGYTNAAPNYYFADKATCTTNASPYACQSGVTANAPGLYIGELPGAVPAGSQVNWLFEVPRWSEEWEDNNRAPTSFISNLLLKNVGFWHRTDSSPSPTLWMGIWNSLTPGWVAGYPHGGNSQNILGNGEFNFPANGSTAGKQASFAVSNTDGHNLTAFRDAFVSTAIVTIADTDAPNLAPAIGPSKWVNQTPTEPITVTAADLGLGVYRLKVAPEGTPPLSPWPIQSNNCTGTTVYPCTGDATFTLTSHGSGGGEVRDYDPSVMPQGANNVLLTAEDPLGNKSETKAVKVWVDHTAPRIAPLSGTLTEQAKVGTNASQYTLKYSATDGDHAAAAAQTPFGGSGTTDGKFNRPQGVAIDSSGNIWVVDKNNNRVQKFDETGKFLLQFGGLGSADGKFNDPRGIAVSSTGTVWVSDIGNKRVQAFNSQGVFIRKITTELNMPYGLATGPGEVLWVSDPGTARINKYSESGSYLGKAYGSAANPTGGSDLNYPVGLATDAAGNVWAVDSGNSKLKKYRSDGKFISQFGTTGTGAGQLQGPLYIAIAPSGHLLVTEETTNRVQVFQPNGVYLRQFGSAGAGNGQFSEARGIAINADNTALAVDAGNHRVTKWSHADLDKQSGVAGIEVKVDGNLAHKYEPGCATEDCAITDKEWTLQAKDYAAGQHTVQVIATDGVGLPTPKPLTITTVKDTTGPQLTANSEFFTAPEGWVEQKSYPYTVSASDTGGYGVKSLALKIDDKVVAGLTQGCPNGGCPLTGSSSINMANYKGGAHPAEVIATDLGGNTTTKKWTINVDPKGTIAGPEAIDTLEASDETAEKTIVASTDEVVSEGEQAEGNDLVIEPAGETLVATGVPTETEFPLDPSAPITVPSPEGSIGIDPLGAAGGTPTTVANGAAIVTPNTVSSVDTVIRPIYDGFLAFANIRDSAAPEKYSWRVVLGKGQSLVQVDEQIAQVIYPEDGTAAALIKAEPAHDATGKELLTSLAVEGSDVVTLTVQHKAAGVVYPVVGGSGFEVGYETVTANIPPESEEEEGPGADGMSFNLLVSAPEPAGKGDPNDASASKLPTFIKTYAAPGCAPLGWCEAWEQRIRGFFFYNGRHAWWKDRSPICTSYTNYSYSIDERYCDWIGPNHQPYGNGYHITSQTRFVVGSTFPPVEDDKAITVRMFGSGGAYAHANDRVCNPSRPECA